MLSVFFSLELQNDDLIDRKIGFDKVISCHLRHCSSFMFVRTVLELLVFFTVFHYTRHILSTSQYPET